MYPGQGRASTCSRTTPIPTGTSSAICRLGDVDEERYFIDIEGGELFVFALRGCREGTSSITYYV